MTALWARLRWFVTFKLSRLAILLAAVIPTSFAYAVANPISYVAYLLCGKERRGIEANLRRILPPGEARKATREVFRNFGRYIIDFYQLPSLGKEELCNRIDFHQWRELHEAFYEGNGTIFVTLHLGQAELGAGALSAYDHPVSVIYEKLEDPRMNDLIQGFREQLGMKIIPAKSAKPGVLRCLNRGEVLGLMFDAVETGDGLVVDFFDGTAEFSATPARIAQRTKARVLPAVVARDPKNPTRLLPVVDFDFHYEPTGDDDADITGLTQEIARSFEAMVTRFPDQWFAFRPVWRETPSQMETQAARKPGTKRWMEVSLQIGQALGSRLPRPLAYGLAQVAGDLAYKYRHGTRADVQDNMRHVMGPQARQDDIERAAREAFRNVARYYVDLIRLPLTTPQRMLDKEVDLYGIERVQEATKRGQGVVVATAHFGNPEIAVQVGALLGLDVLVLAEPLSPPSFDEMMTKMRTTFGVAYEDVSFSAVAHAIKHLRGGGVLAIICDRDIQGTGTPLPFFGEETPLPLGAVELAARTGALLIPGYSRRRGSKFDITFEEPIELEKTGDREADAVTNAKKLLKVAEGWIRSDPGQWMVLERIWKPKLPQLPIRRNGHNGAEATKAGVATATPEAPVEAVGPS
jgi:KDO2-lipid IV(A) lauroyltransferase